MLLFNLLLFLLCCSMLLLFVYDDLESNSLTFFFFFFFLRLISISLKQRQGIQFSLFMRKQIIQPQTLSKCLEVYAFMGALFQILHLHTCAETYIHIRTHGYIYREICSHYMYDRNQVRNLCYSQLQSVPCKKAFNQKLTRLHYTTQLI